MTPHLGTWISALADGQLDPEARERALGHVAGCPSCAEELAAVRAARRALADAGDVPVAPDLTGRLLALGAGPTACAAPDPRRAPATGVWGGPVLGLPAAPLAGERLGERLGDLGGRRPSARAAVLVTAGAIVAGLFALGDAPRVVPETHPAADLALLAAARPTDRPTEAADVSRGAARPAATTAAPVAAGATASGAGTTAAERGPASSTAQGDLAWLDALPAGYAVVSTAVDDAGSRVHLEGPAGPVVVVHQYGRLSDAVVRATAPTTIGSHDVYVLSDAPWHAVWQCGDVVVSVVAPHRAAVAEIVAAQPAGPFDDGLGARLSRGWDVVVGAWSP